MSSVGSLGHLLSEIRLYERASGSRLNESKTQGLWLGRWRGRADKPYGFTWKSTRLKVLGVWIGDRTAGAANYGEQYVAIRAKLRAWRSRPLSPLGKVRVANMFLYSRLWYRTAVSVPFAGVGGVGGYREVEREVATWVFRGKQEVSADRLRDAYDRGGAQLVDIADKVRAQRVAWLCRLLSMPRDSFPRVLAGVLIGGHAGGYSGLEVLFADLGRLRLTPQRGGHGTMAPGGFYWEAVKAWSMITPRMTGGGLRLGSDRLFYNPQITDEAGFPITPLPWMARRGLFSVGQLRGLSGVGLRRHQWDQLVELRGRIPDLPVTRAGPYFVLPCPTGDKEETCISLKDLYLTFRARVDNVRHFEAKWVQALGADLGESWEEVWRRVHGSHCSLFVTSHIWRQLNLGFWTCYMDYAYIARGDGSCPMCGERARERWHVVVDCEVVRRLWVKLGGVVERWGGAVVERREMALGRGGRDPGTAVRNRLGFTLRSAIQSMRGVRVGGVEETVDNIWSLFLRRLRKELVEEWYVASLVGGVAQFEARVLVDGVLGEMRDGAVVWGAIFAGVGYGYWDLFY